MVMSLFLHTLTLGYCGLTTESEVTKTLVTDLLYRSSFAALCKFGSDQGGGYCLFLKFHRCGGQKTHKDVTFGVLGIFPNCFNRALSLFFSHVLKKHYPTL